MQDGLTLSATLYHPRDTTARPAIFALTPYIAQSLHSTGMFFAENGLAFLCVDVRGRGNSDGEFIPFVHEGQDGSDVASWLAGQDFCNGRVAMYGGSYAGFAQWATARTHPPSLATIVPVASPAVGVDFPFRRNIYSSYLMQWLTLVWGRASQDQLFWNNEAYWGGLFRRWYESGLPFGQLDTQIGHSSRHFQSWLCHPCPDAFWDSLNPSREEYHDINMPVLSITGMYDGDQPGALAHFREHVRTSTADHYLIIGPWDHAGTRSPRQEFCGVTVGPGSLIDLLKLHLDWYRWILLGAAKPDFLRDKVAYYVMGSDCWRYAPTLDAITASIDNLYLGSDPQRSNGFRNGRLGGGEVVEGGPDEYVYDPRDTSHAALEATVDPESRSDDRMVHARRGQQLVYHGARFERPREICGFFSLSLWLSIDQPDTDFQATLYDVAPDGRAVQLTEDFLRARYRTDDRTETLVDTTEPLEYEFSGFPFVSYRMKAGHCLRLVFGPIASIYHEKNYNAGGVVAEESVRDARTVTVRLFRDAQRPSVLRVPYGTGEAA